MKHMKIVFLIGIIVVLSSLAVFSFSDKDLVRGDIGEIEEAFLEEDSVDVIVWLKNTEITSPEYQEDLDLKREEIGKMQDKVLTKLSEDDFNLKGRLVVTNGFGGSITETGFQKLKENKNVDSIFMDRKVYGLLDESRPLIKADVVENKFGLTGEGVTICVLDSGVDYTHHALGGCEETDDINDGSCDKVVGGRDYVNGDYNPMDDHGHGTHVAGIAVSEDGTYRGIAPDAKLFVIKVLDETNEGSLFDVGRGLDWCILNAEDFNMKIATMSLGDGEIYSGDGCSANPVLDQAIENAITAEIFLDAASGNDASTQGITYPACALGVTSVGATTKSDDVWFYTNRASNLDLLAPGVAITSTALGGGFVVKSGTSMAAPHVAGLAALLFEVDSGLSPSEIETFMEDTGVLIYDSGTDSEYPRIDALGAVLSLKMSLNPIEGSIEPLNITPHIPP